MKRISWSSVLSWMPALGGFALILSCGGNPSVTDDENGDDSADDDANGRDGGGSDDDGEDDDSEGNGGLLNDDDVPSACEPKTCEELGTDCGFVADGCGEVVNCGKCEDGSECGLLEHNVCTPLDSEELCVPMAKADACDGIECGQEGDGCGGTYDCGECADDEACGVNQPSQCAPAPSDNPDECEAQITSCEEAGIQCGQTGNGCGGLLDCDDEAGGCDTGEICGAEAPGECGTFACEPIDPEVACEDRCGIVSNGCGEEVDGGIIDCTALFPCPAGTACGASGTPNVCGDASEACVVTAEATACAAVECGAVGDGCEGSYSCGGCDAGELCSSGSCVPACTPIAEVAACNGLECGLVSDGCSGFYDCGTCEAGDRCGVLTAFQCDPIPPVVCTPKTAAEACAGRECGQAYDGCGIDPANIFDCATVNGGCAVGEYCGIVAPFQCDLPPTTTDCTPATSCAALGWECGIAFDECGNQFNCATEGLSCNTSVETCIGGVEGPTECVSGTGTPGTGECDVCDSIPNCTGQPQQTRITGRVITPGRNNGDTSNQVGIPNAFVYILRNNDVADLPAIDTGIPAGGESCDRCDEQDLGPVLSSATSDALGNYTISGNIPVGEPFLLVTKIGKWRRAVEVTIAAGNACQTVVMDPVQNTRVPRNMSDGLAANIPRTAFNTGSIDAMECVFFKMGVAGAEFSAGQAGGTARMHLYGRDGAQIDADNESNPVQDELLEDQARMLGYDMVVLDCMGTAEENWPDPADTNFRQYVNRGGRMFASHWSYHAIHDNDGEGVYDPADPHETGLADSATWITPLSNQDSGTGFISVGRAGANPAKIQRFADWMVNEGVTTAPDYDFSITDPREMATAVGTSAEEFVYRSRGNPATPYVQQYAFNTPYGAPPEAACGRTAFSAFHVSPSSGSSFTPFRGADFPNHCTNSAANNGVLTDQEKSLLFMIFDLGACVSEEPPEPPGCTPLDCTGRCGVVSDGCGGTVDCSCPGGQICNVSTGTCDIPQCVPTTCSAQSAECGYIADGCGNALDCGPCPSGQICDGLTNMCEPECTPADPNVACADTCGYVSDGCGDVIECPDCAGALSCIVGQCGDQTCTPQACPAAFECGVASDGCDGTANCGVCTPPETCGGGGVSNVCGIPECDPLTCSEQDAECGWVGNGCGQAVDCGPCPPGQACGAGGPNQCDGCEPRTCAQANNQIPGTGQLCGQIGDGCGEAVDCGPCPMGEICGAVSPNRCGPGTMCTPRTCNQAGAQCGLIGNGCGGTVDCGPCPAGEVCGFETAFQCDAPPPCVPTTCDDAEAECGDVGDGCGLRLSCGQCPANETCTNNQCVPNGTGAR